MSSPYGRCVMCSEPAVVKAWLRASDHPILACYAHAARLDDTGEVARALRVITPATASSPPRRMKDPA